METGINNKKGSIARPGSENSAHRKITKEKIERSKSSLLEREEEYKRLNAELEAKTAELVREAEAIMTEQENFLLKSSPSKSPEPSSSFSEMRKSHSSPRSNQESLSLAAKFGLFDSDEDEFIDDRPQVRGKTSSRSATSSASSARKMTSRTGSGTSATGSRPGTRKTNPRKSTSAKSARKAATVSNQGFNPDEFATKLALAGAITNIEHNMEDGDYSPQDDDVMPAVATEMGSEAQIRFLKAKLRVMQEELERLSQDCRTGVDDRSKLQLALKDASEDCSRLQKTNNLQQAQIEKHKRLLDEEKRKSDSAAAQIQSLKKELDSLKREHRQSSVSHNATEVRLNRALEDVERYKTQLQKDKQKNKEMGDQDRQEMERLRADNKRLERLKGDMTTVFKKQQKLISILKRQILHIEAAKLLSFTEEEFVKALDWENK